MTLVLIAAAVVIPIVGGSTKPLVTPQVEHRVIATTWTKFSTALKDENPAGLRAITTSTAFAAVAGWLSCGCAPWPTFITRIWYSAPPQTSYPLSFFAEIDSDPDNGSTPSYKEVVFTKTGPTRPWRIADVSIFNNSTPLFAFPAYELTPSQNLQASPPTVPEEIGSVLTEFAQFFQQVDQTGTTPPLPRGLKRNGLLLQDISTSEQGHTSLVSAGYSVDDAHRVLQRSPVFAMPYGDLTCIALGSASVITSTSGSTIVQPTNQSQWGDLLAPGTYDSLHELSVFDTCFYELKGGAIYQVTNTGGPVRFTGVPGSNTG